MSSEPISGDREAGQIVDEVHQVALSKLLPGPAVRLHGPNAEHIELLAESPAPLTPIIVQRSTMVVIDGMHRVQAATLRGDTEISVRFFDGTDDDAFVLAVETNVKHGLPLTRSDRSAAAIRILTRRPHWSDRRIASVTGLAPRTLGNLRRRNEGSMRTSESRVGLDGRLRPVSAADGRRAAQELLVARPEASLREIARTAGVAPSTVKDVRERVAAGLDPVPPGQQTPSGRTEQAPRPSAPPQRDRRGVPLDRTVALQSLRNDPSLRFNQTGRILLQWLDAVPVDSVVRQQILDSVPDYRLDTVLALARDNSLAWSALAEQLDHRRRLKLTQTKTS